VPPPLVAALAPPIRRNDHLIRVYRDGRIEGVLALEPEIACQCEAAEAGGQKQGGARLGDQHQAGQLGANDPALGDTIRSR